jgi:hypothetical protein
LTEVALHSNALSPEGLHAVFESQVFWNLTRLSLVGNRPQVVQAALESLRRPRPMCRLRSLTIHGDGLSRIPLDLAAALPAGLPILDISGARLNSAAVREFAGVKALTGLRMLKLSSNHIGNDGAAALFTSPHLAGLKVLDLSYCQVGDDALRALLDDSPLADGLNLLNLTGSPASGDMKLALKNRMGERVRL